MSTDTQNSVSAPIAKPAKPAKAATGIPAIDAETLKLIDQLKAENATLRGKLEKADELHLGSHVVSIARFKRVFDNVQNEGKQMKLDAIAAGIAKANVDFDGEIVVTCPATVAKAMFAADLLGADRKKARNKTNRVCGVGDIVKGFLATGIL